MLRSSPDRCAETALADYLELVLGAFLIFDIVSSINRYGDEHLGYWAAVPEMQALAGKPPGRKQTGGSGFAMTKRSTSHSHILSAFLFPIAVSHTVLFGLCTCFGLISSLCLFFHAIFLFYIVFGLSIFHFFSLLCPPCIPIAFSPCFSFLSVSYSFSSAPLLCHSSCVTSISTLSWVACKGQLVGCNHPGYFQMGAGLQLLETLKPLYPSGTPWLWERKGTSTWFLLC